VVIEVSSNALRPEIQQAEIQATLGWKAETKANRTAQGGDQLAFLDGMKGSRLTGEERACRVSEVTGPGRLTAFQDRHSDVQQK
jgi:hypothetical protein